MTITQQGYQEMLVSTQATIMLDSTWISRAAINFHQHDKVWILYLPRFVIWTRLEGKVPTNELFMKSIFSVWVRRQQEMNEKWVVGWKNLWLNLYFLIIGWVDFPHQHIKLWTYSSSYEALPIQPESNHPAGCLAEFMIESQWYWFSMSHLSNHRSQGGWHLMWHLAIPLWVGNSTNLSLAYL